MPIHQPRADSSRIASIGASISTVPDEPPLPEPASSAASLESLQAALAEQGERLQAFDARLKQGEVSLFRALQTLLTDMQAYRRGEIDFPRDAVLGAFFAWLRPRVVLIVACVAAAIFTGAQLWLLWNQNRLIAQQSEFLRSQTTAAQLSSISALVSSLGGTDTLAAELALPQLSAYGMPAYPILTSIAQSASPRAGLALRALFGQVDLHSVSQIDHVLLMWQRHLWAVQLSSNPDTLGLYRTWVLSVLNGSWPTYALEVANSLARRPRDVDPQAWRRIAMSFAGVIDAGARLTILADSSRSQALLPDWFYQSLKACVRLKLAPKSIRRLPEPSGADAIASDELWAPYARSITPHSPVRGRERVRFDAPELSPDSLIPIERVCGPTMWK